jgi:hypothetical protein
MNFYAQKTKKKFIHLVIKKFNFLNDIQELIEKQDQKS